jgi:hypothetical protein
VFSSLTVPWFAALVVIWSASLLHDQHPPPSNMKLLALLSPALLATALFVDAKTEKT